MKKNSRGFSTFAGTMPLVLSAVLIVSSQILMQQLMQLTLGQSFYAEIAVTLIAFSGMLVGFSGLLGRLAQKVCFVFCFGFNIVMALFYNSVIDVLLTTDILKYAVFVSSCTSLIAAAVIFSTQVYKPVFKADLYLKLNLYSAMVCILILICSLFAGKEIVYALTAGSFLFFALSGIKKSDDWSPGLFGRIQLRAVLIGAISGCFVNYFFNFYKSLFFPTGLEFFFYLFLTFSACAASTYLFLKRKAQLHLLTAQVVALAVVAITAVIFSWVDQNNIFFFDPILISQSFRILSVYPVLVALIMAFLMLPYFLQSFAVPYLQSEDDHHNYLFFTTLGAVLIQAVLLLPFLHLTLNAMLWLLWAMIFVHLVSANGLRNLRLVLPALMILLLMGGVILKLPDLDDRLTAQARRFQLKYWMPDLMLPRMRASPYKKSDFNLRLANKSAAFGGSIPYLNYITFDGYSAEDFTPHDYIKAKLAAHVLSTTKPKRVLLLGLGNHIILKSVLNNSSPDLAVDVVDNSIFFKNEEFLNVVATASGFRWPQPQVKLITEDALHYVYRTQAKYDFVIWNLTLPNYTDSVPLFSASFAKRLRLLMSDNGVLLEPYYGNLSYDCVNYGLYNDIEVLYSQKPLSLVLYWVSKPVSATSERQSAYNSYCKNASKVEFSTQFKGRVFGNGVVVQNKNDLLKNLISNSTEFKEIETFNESTIFESQSPRRNVILNLPYTQMGQAHQDLLKKSIRSQNLFSVSWLDHDNSQPEYKKIKQMLFLYMKESSVLINFAMNEFNQEVMRRPVPYWARPQTAVNVTLDEVEFWDSFVKSNNLSGSSVYVLGPPHLKEHLIQKLLARGVGAESTAADYLILAAENQRDFERLSFEAGSRSYKKILLWSPPWAPVLAYEKSRCVQKNSWTGLSQENFWSEIFNRTNNLLGQQAGRQDLEMTLTADRAKKIETGQPDGCKIKFK